MLNFRYCRRPKYLNVYGLNSALSNPFATRHMWRMALIPKTLKWDVFRKKYEFPNKFLLAQLKNILVWKETVQDLIKTVETT